MGVDVQTVQGPIDSSSMGVTLPHEHVFIDERPFWNRPDTADAASLACAHAPFSVGLLSRLVYDPLMSLDNLQLLDEQAAIEELALFRAAGGLTVVDQSCRGMGRDAAALRRVSEATGLHIVMATGYYLEPSYPPEVAESTAEELAEVMGRELEEGTDGTGIRAGIIGEIGISKDFTLAERKCLRAAAVAQSRAGVPLQLHLPGWHRYGHDVLDIVEDSGANVAATVLCHMSPSLGDLAYQKELAGRGAWLGYDMIGMDYYYPGHGQSPCDEEIARALVGLIDDGCGSRLLLSSDTYLKMMLVRNGGFGYAHVVTAFAERLRRHGLRQADLDHLCVANPARLFEVAAGAVS